MKNRFATHLAHFLIFTLFAVLTAKAQCLEPQLPAEGPSGEYDMILTVTRADDFESNVCDYQGTFRWALMKASYNSTLKTKIVFALPLSAKNGQGQYVINITYNFPLSIPCANLTIDGASQDPSYNPLSTTNPPVVIDFHNNNGFNMTSCSGTGTEKLIISSIYFKNYIVASNPDSYCISLKSSSLKNIEMHDVCFWDGKGIGIVLADYPEVEWSGNLSMSYCRLGRDKNTLNPNATLWNLGSIWTNPSIVLKNCDLYRTTLNNYSPYSSEGSRILVKKSTSIQGNPSFNIRNSGLPNDYVTFYTGNNTSGNLTFCANKANRVDIYKSNAGGRDALEYVGVALKTGTTQSIRGVSYDNYAYNPAGADPEDSQANTTLEAGQYYVAVASNNVGTASFSSVFQAECPHFSFPLSTDYDGDGLAYYTYFNAYVVTRTDDFNPNQLNGKSLDDCDFVGTLRWALLKKNLNNRASKIVFRIPGQTNPVIKIDIAHNGPLPLGSSFSETYLTVDGLTQDPNYVYASSTANPPVTIDFEHSNYALSDPSKSVRIFSFLPKLGQYDIDRSWFRSIQFKNVKSSADSFAFSQPKNVGLFNFLDVVFTSSSDQPGALFGTSPFANGVFNFTSCYFGTDKVAKGNFQGQFGQYGTFVRNTTLANVTSNMANCFFAGAKEQAIYNSTVNSTFFNGSGSVFVGNTKNNTNAALKTILYSTTTSIATVKGGSTSRSINKIDAYETDLDGINALKWVASYTVNLASSPSTIIGGVTYYDWQVTTSLSATKRYVFVGSTSNMGGEFSQAYPAPCTNYRAAIPAEYNDGNTTYDKVYVVTRTDDPCSNNDLNTNLDDCNCVGTLRWAAKSAALNRGATKKNRIIFDLPSNDTTIALQSPIHIASEGQGWAFGTISIDGSTQAGYSNSASKNPKVQIDCNGSYFSEGGYLSSANINIKGIFFTDFSNELTYTAATQDNNHSFDNCVFANPTGITKSYIFNSVNTSTFLFKGCTFGKDRSGGNAYNGTFGQLYNSNGAFEIYDSEFYHFSNGIVKGGYNRAILTRTIFVGNTKNIHNPGFNTLVSGQTQQGGLFGGTNNDQTVRVEIYRTNSGGVDAVEYMGQAIVKANEVLDGNAGYYRWDYVPGGGNKFLVSGESYIAVASTVLTSGEFSVPFSASFASCVVVNTNDTGTGSLRAAIDCANASSELAVIRFQIPGNGPHVIQPITNLPNLSSNIIVDAFTQAGDGVYDIVLDGSIVDTLGLRVGFNSKYITIRGFSFRNFKDGVVVIGGCDSTSVMSNKFSDISGNAISLIGNCLRNTVSDNMIENVGGVAVSVYGSCTKNLVLRNSIDHALVGIQVYGGSDENQLVANRITNTDSNAVEIQSSSNRNVIKQNTIGLSKAHGISMFYTANGNRVIENYIGTDSLSAALHNDKNGIYLAANSDKTFISGNVIGNNGREGIYIASKNDTLVGNFIGLAKSLENIGNTNNGVYIDYQGGHNAIIGGNNPFDPNTIANNKNGIYVSDYSQSNTFLKNRFLNNSYKGIYIVFNAGISIEANANNGKRPPVVKEVVKTTTGYTFRLLTQKRDRHIEVFSSDFSGQTAFNYLPSTCVPIKSDSSEWRINVTTAQTIPYFSVTSQDKKFNTSELGSNQEGCLTVVNTNDEGQGSLREAIKCANLSKDTSIIRFDIPTSDPAIIQVSNQLPLIYFPTIINASSQKVVLKGSGGASYYAGLKFDDDSLGGTGGVIGLTITGFSRGMEVNFTGDFVLDSAKLVSNIGDGILLQNGLTSSIGAARNFRVSKSILSDNTGEGFSTNADNVLIKIDSSEFRHNGGSGIYFFAQGTMPCSITHNLIGGNGQYGIDITRTSDPIISYNTIGLTRNLSQADPNGESGIRRTFSGGSVGSIHHNIVCANLGHGIEIDDSRDSLLANYIGITPSGANFGNALNGIETRGNNAIIGRREKGNYICFNSGHGIKSNSNGDGDSICYNYIGVSPSFTPAGNGLSGIEADYSKIRYNYIGSNGHHGIDVVGGAIVKDNFIGTNELGQDLGNNLIGIKLDGSTLDGDTIKNNTIAFNLDGAQIANSFKVISNRFFSNDHEALKILKYNNKLSKNIFLGTVSGFKAIKHVQSSYGIGNEDKQSPVFSQVSYSDDILTLSGTAQASDSIEVFVTDSSHAQTAAHYLGHTKTDSNGNWALHLPGQQFVNKGVFFVATATGSTNNTSELSTPFFIKLYNGTCVVTDTTDQDVPGSLREAIRCANNGVNGKPVISFAIDTEGPHEIKLKTSLPRVKNIFGDSVVIDGSTQALYSGNPLDSVVISSANMDTLGSYSLGRNSLYKTRIESLMMKGVPEIYFYQGMRLEKVKFVDLKVSVSGKHTFQVFNSTFDQSWISCNYGDSLQKLIVKNSILFHDWINVIWVLADTLEVVGSDLKALNGSQVLYSNSKINLVQHNEFSGAIYLDGLKGTFHNNEVGVDMPQTSSSWFGGNVFEMTDNVLGGPYGFNLRIYDTLVIKGNTFGYSFSRNKAIPFTDNYVSPFYVQAPIRNVKIDSNFFYNMENSGNAVLFFWGSQVHSKKIEITRNVFGSSNKIIDRGAIRIMDYEEALISDNIFDHCHSNELDGVVYVDGPSLIKGNLFKEISIGYAIYSNGEAIVKQNEFRGIEGSGIYIGNKSIEIDSNVFENINTVGVVAYNSDTSQIANITNNTFSKNTLSINVNSGNVQIHHNTFATDSTKNNGLRLGQETEYRSYVAKVSANKVTATSSTPGSFINFGPADDNVTVFADTITGYANSSINVGGTSNKKLSRNILDHPTKAIDLARASGTPGNGNKKSPILSGIVSTPAGFVVSGKATPGDSVEVFITYIQQREKTSRYITTKYVSNTDSTFSATIPFALSSDYDTVVVRTTATSGFNTSELSNKVVFCIKCPCVVTNKSDNASLGSLRYAIACANGKPVDNVISFAIPTAGPHQINLSDSLPSMRNFNGRKISVDGATQTGTGDQSIIINGGGLSNKHGMRIYNKSEVKNLRFDGFWSQVSLRLVNGGKAENVKFSSDNCGISAENYSGDTALNVVRGCQFYSGNTGISNRFFNSASPAYEGRFTCENSYFWSQSYAYRNDWSIGGSVAKFQNCYFGTSPTSSVFVVTFPAIQHSGTGGANDLLEVTGCSFSGCGNGAIVSSNSNISIVGNYFGLDSANRFAVLTVGPKRKNHIKDNTIAKIVQYSYAIKVEGDTSRYTLIQGNKIGYGLGTAKYALTNSSAIWLTGTGKHRLEGNSIYKPYKGIDAVASTGDAYSYNTIQEANIGIETQAGSAYTMEVNTISNSNTAMSVKGNNCVFRGNILSSGADGINYTGNGALFSYNTVSNFSNGAILLTSSSNNRLEYNTLSNPLLPTGTASGIIFNSGSLNNYVYGGSISAHAGHGIYLNSGANGNKISRVLINENTKAITLGGGNNNRKKPIIHRMELREGKIRMNVEGLSGDSIEVFTSKYGGQRLVGFVGRTAITAVTQDIELDLGLIQPTTSDTIYARITATNASGTSEVSDLAMLCPKCVCLVTNTQEGYFPPPNGSIRKAITDANAGKCGIVRFAISPSLNGDTIVLQGGLPAIVTNMFIDGSSESGYVEGGNLAVWLTRQYTGDTVLNLKSDNIRIKGIGIKGFNVGINIKGKKDTLQNMVVLGTQYEYLTLQPTIYEDGNIIENCRFGTTFTNYNLGNWVTNASGVSVNGSYNRFVNTTVANSRGYNVAFLNNAKYNRFDAGSLRYSGGSGIAYRRAIYFQNTTVQDNQQTPVITGHTLGANGSIILEGTTQSATDQIQIYAGNGIVQNAITYLPASVVVNGNNWTATIAGSYLENTQYYFIASATNITNSTSPLSKLYKTIPEYDVCTVTTTNETGIGSIRDAVSCVNSAEGLAKIEFAIPNPSPTIYLSNAPLAITNTVGSWVDGIGKNVKLVTYANIPIRTEGNNMRVEGLSLEYVDVINTGSGNTFRKMTFIRDSVKVTSTVGRTNLEENIFEYQARLAVNQATQVRISKNTFIDPFGRKAITLKNNGNNNFPVPTIKVQDAYEGKVYLKVKAQQPGDTIELFTGTSNGQVANPFLSTHVAGDSGIVYVELPLAVAASSKYFAVTARDANWNTSELGSFKLGTCLVSSTANAGANTLRQAITDANANNCNIILFNIASTPKTINVDTELPAITRAGVVVDGTSQSGYLPDRLAIVSVSSSQPTYRKYGLKVQNASDVKVRALISVKMDTAFVLKNAPGTLVDRIQANTSGIGIGIDKLSHRASVSSSVFGAFQTGAFLTYTGIVNNEAQKVQIRNSYFILSKNNTGIKIDSAIDLNIDSCVFLDIDFVYNGIFSSATSKGIVAQKVKNAQITGNSFSNVGLGVSLKLSSGDVKQNLFSSASPTLHVDSGITVSYSRKVNVSKNHFKDWRKVAIAFRASKVNDTIFDNTIERARAAGISIEAPFRGRVYLNSIAQSDSIGIKVANTTDSVLVDTNTIANAKVGIRVQNASKLKIGNNNLYRAQKGIILKFSSAWVGKNKFLDTTKARLQLDTGIVVYNSQKVKLELDSLKDKRTVGIALRNGLATDSIYYCSVDSTNMGILVDHVTGGFFEGNAVTTCDSIGLRLDNTVTGAFVGSSYLKNCRAQGLYVGGNGNKFYLNMIGAREKFPKAGNKKGVLLLGNNNIFGDYTKGNYIGNNQLGGIENRGTGNSFVYNTFEHNDSSRTRADHKAIENKNGSNNGILPPYDIFYTRQGGDYLIHGKAATNDSIHIYLSYGFPQDAIRVMGLAKAGVDGTWSFLFLESNLDTNRTTYLVATATSQAALPSTYARTSELSKIIPIGKCIISEIDDVADNQYPLDGSVRAAVVCANMLPERAQIITKIYPEPNAVLRGPLPVMTNRYGFDWSGRNLTRKSAVQRLNVTAVTESARELALHIKVPTEVGVDFLYTNFNGFKQVFKLKVDTLRMEAVGGIGYTDPVFTTPVFATSSRKPVSHLFDTLGLQNFSAFYKVDSAQTKMENLVLGRSTFDHVAAVAPQGTELDNVLIYNNSWKYTGAWLSANVVKNTWIRGNTFLQYEQPATLQELVKITNAENVILSRNAYSAGASSPLSSMSAIVHLSNALHARIDSNTIRAIAEVAAVKLGSDSVNSSFNKVNNNTLQTNGRGIVLAGKESEAKNDTIISKLHGIEANYLVKSVLKANNIVVQDTSAIKLNYSWRVKMSRNLMVGNTGATKIVDINKGKVNVSNRNRETPELIEIGSGVSSEGRKVRVLYGTANANDRIEVYLSEKDQANSIKYLSDEVLVNPDGTWKYQIPRNWYREQDKSYYLTVMATAPDSTSSEMSHVIEIAPYKEVFVVKNTNDDGAKSFRAAIDHINGSDFYTEVLFQIPSDTFDIPFNIPLTYHVDTIYNYSGFHINGASQKAYSVDIKGDVRPQSAVINIVRDEDDVDDSYALDVRPYCGDSSKITHINLVGYNKGVRLQTGQVKLDNVGIMHTEGRADTAICVHKVTADTEDPGNPEVLYELKDDKQQIRGCSIIGYNLGIAMKPGISRIGIRDNYFDEVNVGVVISPLTEKSIVTGNVFLNVDQSGVVLKDVGIDNAVENNWFGYAPTSNTAATRMNNAVFIQNVSQNLVINNKVVVITQEQDVEDAGTGVAIYVTGNSRQNAIRDNQIGWGKTVATYFATVPSSFNNTAIGIQLEGESVYNNRVLANQISYVHTGIQVKGAADANTGFNQYTGNSLGTFIELKGTKLDTTYYPIYGNAFQFENAHNENVVGNNIGSYGATGNGIKLQTSQEIYISKNMIRSAGDGVGIFYTDNSNKDLKNSAPVISSRALVDENYLKLSGTAPKNASGYVEVFVANGNKSQSQVYVGRAPITIVEPETLGRWEIQVPKLYWSLKDRSYFVATYENGADNTSPFSAPFPVENLVCAMSISSIDPAYLVCPGVETTLSAQIIGAVYTWDSLSTGGQPVIGGPKNVVLSEGGFKATFKEKGNYRLTVKDSYGQCSVTKDFVFNHKEKALNPNFLVHDTVFANDTVAVVDLNYNTSETHSAFTWDFGKANVLESSAFAGLGYDKEDDDKRYKLIVFPVSGEPTVIKQKSTRGECAITMVKSIVVLPRPTDGSYKGEILLPDARVFDFKVYPNPLNRGNLLNVTFYTNSVANFSIFFVRVSDGLALQRYNFTKEDLREAGPKRYDFENTFTGFDNLPSGTYFVRVEMPTEVKTIKIVVQ